MEELRISGSITSQNSSLAIPDTFSGSIELVTPVENPCFSLPFNDAELKSRNKLVARFNVTPIGRDRRVLISGGSKILAGSHPYEEVDQRVIRVKAAMGSSVRLDFVSQVPRLANDHPDQWFFHGFYPQILSACYESNTDPVVFETISTRTIKFSSAVLPEWKVLIPGVALPQVGHITEAIDVPNLGFVAVRNLQTAQIKVGEQFLHLAYSDPEFLRLIPTLQEAFAYFRTNFGALKLADFWVLETNQFEDDDIPGMVFLNRARQDSIHEFQSSWLNWMHWASVSVMARQWFGGFVRAATINDDWMMRGTAEYAALTFLQQYEARFEFFNMQDGATSWLDFNFREMQDTGLTVLFQDNPEVELVDKKFVTKIPYPQQHPMQPLRHAAALRHLASILGKDPIANVLREIHRAGVIENVTPLRFAQTLSATLTQIPNGDIASAAFTRWWTEAVWLDASFDSLSQKKSGGKFDVSVSLSFRTDFITPVRVSFTDNSGAQDSFLVVPKDRIVTIDRRVAKEVKTVTIDEERDIFDVDRYNNSSALPKIRFYPGNAKGILDNGYTIVWLPYPFRRAGQGWALALQSVLFRYINNAASLRIEREFSNKQRMGFSFSQNFIAPREGLGAQIIAQQDFYGSRKLELSTLYNPRLFDWVGLQFGGAVRHRLVVGHAHSDHLTGALSLYSNLPGDRRFWNYRLRLENEKAPEQESANFSYDRRLGVVDLEFLLFSFAEYKLRLFRGVIESQGEAPAEVFFRPAEISEARMRIDQSAVVNAKNFSSVGQDILIPLVFNVPDLGILSTSRMKWRLFYDFGRNLNDNISLADGGVGIDAPLGGDLSGVGSLSISKMSLMGVLYSRVGDDIQKKPSILFNIGSEF